MTKAASERAREEGGVLPKEGGLCCDLAAHLKAPLLDRLLPSFLPSDGIALRVLQVSSSELLPLRSRNPLADSPGSVSQSVSRLHN